jgi:hypothetical protein
MKKYSVSVVFLTFLVAIGILFAVMPWKDYSENEKRELAESPKFTQNALVSDTFGKELETYLADHFPLRDFFVGVHAYYEQALGLNGKSGIYAGKDGYLIARPATLDEANAANNVKYLRQFAESTGLPASVMVVPYAGYVLESKLPAICEAYWDDTLMEIAQNGAGEMDFIDLRQDFLQDSEGLYYRTDHHLTSLGSYRMYLQFCAARGITPVEFSLAESYDGFYGTGYSQSGLWGKKADVLEIWKPENPGTYKVTIRDDKETTHDGLYFADHLQNMDKYPVFLDGNHKQVIIENENCQNGKVLLLLKDSYAHCFATFAIEHYEKIVMVDMRYNRESLKTMMDTHSATEILFLYGSENLATSTDLAWVPILGS